MPNKVCWHTDNNFSLNLHNALFYFYLVEGGLNIMCFLYIFVRMWPWMDHFRNANSIVGTSLFWLKFICLEVIYQEAAIVQCVLQGWRMYFNPYWSIARSVIITCFNDDATILTTNSLILTPIFFPYWCNKQTTKLSAKGKC